MERILLVEDNKALSKLIAKKLSSKLDFEVDIAHSHKEAQLFMRKYSYFISLLDINLPDAPNGEIVDTVLENKIPVIVLSANVDRDFRKHMLKKDIIDYIAKGGVSDINYIISSITRLSKNREHKVLVVDDSIVFRKNMQKMLSNMFFKVYAVGHGEEAMGMLKEQPDIKIVLTDYAMPVMDGLELTKEIRKTFTKNELSILAISSNEDDDVSAMFLKNGASDFIKKPFSKEEFSCRINNAIEALENIDTLTNHANRDFLTGLYNKNYFFKTVPEYFEKMQEEDEEFVIAMVDIDNFKNIIDTFGSEISNRVIVHLSEILRSNTKHSDMVTKFGGEEFCLFLRDIHVSKVIDVLENLRYLCEMTPLILDDKTEVNFTISVGFNTQYEDSLDDALSQADMALYNAKNSGGNRVLSK